MTAQEKLAKYVSDKLRENNLSTYMVEERARRKGYSITQSYVNRIRIGKAGNVSTPKQTALAAGLGVNPQEIYDLVAGVERKPKGFSEEVLAAFAGAEQLTTEQKSELLRLVKRLVKAIRAENEAAGLSGEEHFDEAGVSPGDFRFVAGNKKKSA